LWESAAMEVAHLLGVGRPSQDWLVCQLGGFTSGLTALDVATGRPAAWGYQRTGAEPEAPFGRGFLVEDRVVWPTRAAGVRRTQGDRPTSPAGSGRPSGDGGAISRPPMSARPIGRRPMRRSRRSSD